MSPSPMTSFLFVLAFLAALAFVGPYGGAAIWTAFFFVCFVQLKPKLPAEESCDNETASAGDRKRKRQSDEELILGQLLVKLSQAIDLVKQTRVLYIVLFQVLFFCYTVVLLLSPSAKATNSPHQPPRKRTRVEEPTAPFAQFQ